MKGSASWWTSLAVAGWLLSAESSAQTYLGDHPNRAKGFNPSQAYQFGEIAHINLFNGNLNISLPIGQEYKVDGALSYGLTLSYSNNNWDESERTEFIDENYPEPGYWQTWYFLTPSRRNNAGLGWLLSLGGELLPPGSEAAVWRYRSPDGADHPFDPKLHPTDPNELAFGPAGDRDVSYTRDGTYLRMVKTTCSDGSSCRDIESPDGIVRRFSSTTGRLEQMRDRFGNALGLTYSTNPATGAPVWTIEEPEARRTHTITFTRMTVPTDNTFDPPVFDVVKEIRLTAFAGQTSVYTFRYWPDGAGVDRPVRISRAGPNGDPLLGGAAWVPLLTEIAFPDGSSYKMLMPDGSPAYYRGDGTYTDETGVTGHLSGLTLPTLGRYEWDYRQYTFPPQAAGEPPEMPALGRSIGVAEQRMIDAAGSVHSKTRYETNLIPLGSYSQARVLENTVRYLDPSAADALIARDVNYFSVDWTSENRQVAEYGLPLTREAIPNPAIGTDVDNPRIFEGRTYFLSSKRYDSTDVLLRSEYLRYESDAANGSTPGPENRRLAARLVAHHTSGGGVRDIATTDFSDFDGLGHYRTTTTGGDFPGQTIRIATVDYNRARTDVGGTMIDVGTWNPATPGQGFTMLTPSTGWVLNTHSAQTTSEGGITTTALFCFERGTGFLERVRRMAGSAASSVDTITRFGRNTIGNVVTTEWFGGEFQTVNTDALCSSGISGGPATYTITQTYSGGSIATSQYSGVPFLSANNTIDQTTGFAQIVTDSAGRSTSLSYDTIGRLVSESAPGEAPTNYAYTNAALSAGALVPATASVTSVSSSPDRGAVRRASQYDSFGRVWREERLMPDGSWSVMETLYDALGRRKSLSEWSLVPANEFTPLPNTTRFTYDVLGRLTQKTAPDGRITQYTYDGSISTTRVETYGASNTSRSTRETYDRFGRLFSVTEALDTTLQALTTYGYDPAGHVTSVAMTCRDAWLRKRQRSRVRSSTNERNNSTPGTILPLLKPSHTRIVISAASPAPFQARPIRSVCARATAD